MEEDIKMLVSALSNLKEEYLQCADNACNCGDEEDIEEYGECAYCEAEQVLEHVKGRLANGYK